MLGAGLCKAVLRVFEFDNQDLHKNVWTMLPMFLDYLSKKSYNTALTILVAGNVMELALEHYIKGGVNSPGAVMLRRFWAAAEGQKRMSAPGVMDQLIAWIAKGLQSVRNIVVDYWKLEVVKGKDWPLCCIDCGRRQRLLDECLCTS